MRQRAPKRKRVNQAPIMGASVVARRTAVGSASQVTQAALTAHTRGAIRTCSLASALLVGALALVGCGPLGATPIHPVATTTPTPAAAAGVIYQDALTDHPAGWPTTNGCAFHADGYHVTSGAICPAPLAHPVGDVAIRVTAQAVMTTTSTSNGVVFRLVNFQNYYGFEITPNGKWTFYKEVNGVFHALVNYTFVGAIQMGSTARNTLEVDAHGSHFVFLDDGVTVGQGDDSSFATGGCGVDGANGAEVVYTDFRVARV